MKNSSTPYVLLFIPCFICLGFMSTRTSAFVAGRFHQDVTPLKPSGRRATVAPNYQHTILQPMIRRQQTKYRMFTGIVEEMGQVLRIEERDDLQLWDGSVGRGMQLTVGANTVLQGAYLGCSICVSGVCLTATALTDDSFTVGLAPETLRRTYFGTHLRPGDRVNLERASEIGGRNSGHFVQGHVDGTGEIMERRIDGDSLFYRVMVSAELLKYIVPKGFIAIDGTSLTVIDVDHSTNTFSFMLIEYTQKKIIVPAKFPGDLVNIEVDVLAKYSEAALAPILPRLEALESRVKELEAELQVAKSNATK